MFLEYLDSKTEYLKSKTRPLNSHEMKKFCSSASMKVEQLVILNLRGLKRLVKKTNKKLETNAKNYRNEQWW